MDPGLRSTVPRNYSGCQNCRELHVKCDRVTPICGRCLAAKRKCRRLGIKFRPSGETFSKTQRWMKPLERLIFIDETAAVSQPGYPNEETYDLDDVGILSYSHDYSEGPGPLKPSAPSVQHGPPKSSGSAESSQSTATVRGLTLTPAITSTKADRFIPAHDPSGHHPLIPQPDSDSRPLPGRSTQYDLSQQLVYRQDPMLPLESEAEAALYQHYVRNLANWLDQSDPQKSFENIVPDRAGNCTVLMKAIFALAARHKSHVDGTDPFVANRYHEECLKFLIPMIDHATTISDEDLFAASIILRMFEEMEVKHTGIDNHGYLLSICAFVERRGRPILPRTLNGASFWVGLRQEIYSAVMNHQPVRLSLVDTLVDRSLSEADQWTWANRAVVHCADVLNLCFGRETPGFTSSWEELDAWNKEWLVKLPLMSGPIFRRSWDGSPGTFPKIRYYSGCHTIGIQHHILAALLLARFNPKVPKVGVTRRSEERQIEERIQALVRESCGIGLGNQWSPPNMFTVCMIIATFGDQFSDRQDQEAMIDILKKTEKDHARPTEAVQEQMKKSWGWMLDN